MTKAKVLLINNKSWLVIGKRKIYFLNYHAQKIVIYKV